MNCNAVIADNNNFISFEYKAKLLGNTVAPPNPNNANKILEIQQLLCHLKHLSNFWRLLEMPLINCKVKLNLKWTYIKT